MSEDKSETTIVLGAVDLANDNPLIESDAISKIFGKYLAVTPEGLRRLLNENNFKIVEK